MFYFDLYLFKMRIPDPLWGCGTTTSSVNCEPILGVRPNQWLVWFLRRGTRTMTLSFRHFWLLVVLALCASTVSAQIYWEPLIRRENLAGPLAYEQVVSFSSQGWGITNEDRGNYLGRDGANWNILCDIEGPGVLTEFGWSRRSPSATLRFQIYVDDTTASDLNVRADSLCGRMSPFLPPLADSTSGWSWNYAPVPFQQHLRITYTGNTMAYHGSAVIFADSTEFESFRVPVPLSYYLKRDTMETAWSQPARPAMWNRTALNLAVDSTLESFDDVELLSHSGSGVVRKFWMIPQDITRSYLDRTVARIYVDRNPEPAIVAPVGMFFGCSHGSVDYQSAITGRVGDTLYFQGVMPFSTEIRIEIQNNVVAPATNRIQLGVDIVELNPADVPEFRLGGMVSTAVPTRRYDPFRAAEFSGHGNYLGLYLELDNTSGSVLEGDELLYVDGALVRGGVGTPEYFNGSGNWIGPNGQAAISRQYAHGVVTVNGNDYGAYRYHLSDAVPFSNSLALDFEIGGWGQLTGNYRSFALAYLEPQRFTVRDQDSSRVSTGGELLTIFGRGLNNDRELQRVTWNGISLDMVSGGTTVEDSILLVVARAPFTSSGTAALIAEFSDGTETIAPAWSHRAEPDITFRVLRDDIDGYAYAGDTLDVELFGYPEGESATVVFMDQTLPWTTTTLPHANENGVIRGRVVFPLDPSAMPEGRAPLTAQAHSIEGYPEAVSSDELTALRVLRIEAERMSMVANQGVAVTDLCATDYQFPEDLDPWGRMVVRQATADTVGEFIRFGLPIAVSGNYRLNYFYATGFTPGLMRIELDDSLEADSILCYNPSLPEGTWDRSDTLRGEWRYLLGGVHTVKFIASNATPFQETFDVILDQILLESEFHSWDPDMSASLPEVPRSAELHPPYPNPFNSTAQLRFSLAHTADVKLEVFNLLGQRVATLINERLTAGDHIREFSCPDCASGLYLARLSLPNNMMTRKLLLLK